jgi:hypothetical protein
MKLKLYRILLASIVIMGVAISCKDAEPSIPYNVFNFGAYARTINIASGNIPLTDANFDVNDGRFEGTVQIVDEKDGDLMESMDIYVKYTRVNANSGGPATTAEFLVRTVPASAFTRQPAAPQPGQATPTGRTDGKADRTYPTHTFIVTAPEMATLTGVDINALTSVQAGNAFDIRLVLNLKDGRKFTNSNSNGDVTGGPFYNSPFFYRVPFICGLPDGYALGNYALTQTAGSTTAFGGAYTRFADQNVTLQLGSSSTLRSFTVGYYTTGGSPIATPSFTFNLVCNTVVKVFQGTGLACGGGPLELSNNADNPGFYDEGDDSVIVIRLIDDATGGCGQTAEVELTLTKI